ncbi:MAG: FkbM family methyltransferase [Hyphomicrobiaceae bacterium]
MLIDRIKLAKKLAGQMVLSVTRKAAVLASGRSPVTSTCQIPALRAKYDAIGLDPTRGVFVEIGGYDGETHSNTAFLADQGWRGVYVEPIPDFCRQIKARHWLNDVVVEPMAAGDARGRATMHQMGPLTTRSEDTRDAFRGLSWSAAFAARSREVQVHMDTLSAILERNRVPRSFDLMVVDVEGAEEQIIADLLASAWRPRALVIELLDAFPGFENFPETRSSAQRTRVALTQDGYRAHYVDELNTIFVR